MEGRLRTGGHRAELGPLLGVTGELDDHLGQPEDLRVDPGGHIDGGERYRFALIEFPGVDGLEDGLHPRPALHVVAGEGRSEERRQRPGGGRPQGIGGGQGRGHRLQHSRLGVLRQAHQVHHRVGGHVPGQRHSIEPALAVLRDQPPRPHIEVPLQAGDRPGSQPVGQDLTQPCVLLTVERQDRPGQGRKGSRPLGTEDVGGTQDRGDLVVPRDRPHAVALQVDRGTHPSHRLVHRVGVLKDPLVQQVEVGRRDRGHEGLRGVGQRGCGGGESVLPGRHGGAGLRAVVGVQHRGCRSRAAVSGQPHGTGVLGGTRRSGDLVDNQQPGPAPGQPRGEGFGCLALVGQRGAEGREVGG